MKRKEKFNILAIIIASTPLLGAIYFANADYINVAKSKNEISFTLDDSNTPEEINQCVDWNDPDEIRQCVDWNNKTNGYCFTYRYTEFHYNMPVLNPTNGHIVLTNMGGGIIQNKDPLIYEYTVEFKITAELWAEAQLTTSYDYDENLSQYTLETSQILCSWNTSNSYIITKTLTKPYFSIHCADGNSILLEYLTISYSC